MTTPRGRKIECIGGPLCGQSLWLAKNEIERRLVFVRPKGIQSPHWTSDKSPLVVDPPPTSPIIETYRGTYILVQYYRGDGIAEDLWWDGEE